MKATPPARRFNGIPRKRKPVDDPDKRLAGVPWPASYMPESKFQAHCEDVAAQFGWMASHSHLPYFDTAGWPDLALVHEKKGLFMVRELKVTSAQGRIGKPTPMQWRWLAALTNAGVDAGVWTWPQDRDRLIAELMAG